MKKLFLILFTFHCSLFTLFAQTWEPVGGGITCPDNVYEMGIYQDTIHGEVLALCVYYHKLYAGGLFTTAGNIHANNIACWDGHKWDSLYGGTDRRVESFGVSKNQLIIGGNFTKANGKHAAGVAKWLDTIYKVPFKGKHAASVAKRADTLYMFSSWYYFQRGLYNYLQPNDDHIGAYYKVHAICYLNGETYITGLYNLTNTGDADDGFSYWDEGKKRWEPVTNQVPDSINMGYGIFRMSIAVYRNKIYLLSVLTNGEERKCVLAWDGTKYSELPNLPYYNFGYSCIAASDSGLYLASRVDASFKNYPSIIRLNNDGSYTLIKGLPDKGEIKTMVFYKGKLYVAGSFKSIGGIKANNIACWDGKSWSALGEGFSSNKKNYPAKVTALCIYKGELYAAGYFNSSGGKPVMNIARLKLDNKEKAEKAIRHAR